MSSPVEATVSTEPKSIVEHYEAAKAAQATETTETVADDTSTTTQPAEDPAKPADQTKDTGEEDALSLATKEEIAQLTPHHRKLYEKMQKDYTQKTQKLSAERKEMEQWKPLIDSLQTNPEATLDAVAKQYGFSLTKPQDNTAKEQAKDIVDQLPEELAFLEKPLEARIQKALDSRLKPLEESHARMASETAAAETKATLEAFSSKYPEWQKHEKAMMAEMERLTPKGMTDFEYMEKAYRLATFEINKAEETKKVVNRIEKSAAASEPNVPGISNQRVAHKRPPNATIFDAHEAAKRGEVWED